MKTHYISTLAYVRDVNKDARAKDESHLFPIRGKFNVTERAIRQLRKAQSDGLVCDDYEAALEVAMSQIVNDERNW